MRGKNKLIASVVFATAVLVGAVVPLGGAQAVSLVNGSFESGTDPGGSFIPVGPDYSNTTAITGWTVGGTDIGSWQAGVDYIGGLWAASQGSRSLDLNEYAPGSISQNVTGFTVGNVYKVSFDMAGNTGGGPTVKTLDVSISAPSGSYGFSFDTTGYAYQTNMGWTQKSFTFTAGSTSELLAFISTTSGYSGNDVAPYAFGPALDNVAITDLGPSPTPLPSTWLMLLSGFVGLGFFAYRGTKKRSAFAAA
jgi:choice-of-anchor C domain-containing protein